MTLTSRNVVPRVALGLVAAAQAEIGIWGLLAPHDFFSEFPGFGHHWVAELGVYNQHLVRDYAAAELGFAVLLGSAAVLWSPQLVRVAGWSFLAATVPHLAYHFTTTGSFSTSDNVLSIGSFWIEIGIVLAAMLVVGRERSSDGAHQVS